MKKHHLYIIYLELFELVTLDPVSYGMLQIDMYKRDTSLAYNGILDQPNIHCIFSKY